MKRLQIENRIVPSGLSVRVTAAHVPGDMENRALRQAVQDNLVSFPSQVPVFARQSRPDLQQKVVVLYFVRGWTMDDIAKRYGLGRQRMGQILTAWRIRAVKEGYVNAIEPEHPLFQRVRLVEVNQSTEMQVQTRCGAMQAAVKTIPLISEALVPTPEVHQLPSGMASVTDRGGSNLAEQLHAMVDVLDNQLGLRSNHSNGNIESCEPLLTSARTLCERLESNLAATQSDGEWRTAAAISAAKQLFRRFEEHALERSAPYSEPARSLPSVGRSRNVPPRTSQRVAIGL
jgi:hypothetical protein